MITRRKFDPHILSLVHFDYPYPKEEGQMTRDEINRLQWTLQRRSEWGTPYIPRRPEDAYPWGYRGLVLQFSQPNIDFDFYSNDLMGTPEEILLGQPFEFEMLFNCNDPSGTGAFFVMTYHRKSDNATYEFISLGTGRGPNGLNDNRQYLQIVAGSVRGNIGLFTLDEWHHIKVQVHEDDGVTAYLDGKETKLTGKLYTDDMSGQPVHYLRFKSDRGNPTLIDEFVLRDTHTPNVIPTAPYQGELDVSLIGGWGNGTQDLTFTGSRLNYFAFVKSASGTKVTLSSSDGFSEGTEVMFHVTAKKTSNESELGYYAIRRIVSQSGNVITLDKAVTEEFNLSSCASKYYVQAITIPNYRNFTLNKDYQPYGWTSTSPGGIFALKATGNVTINGNIQMMGTGPSREDSLQVTHADMIDRFLIGSGGGIFIVAGGTLTINGAIGDCTKPNSFTGEYTEAGYGGDSSHYDATSAYEGSVGFGGGNHSGNALEGYPGHDGYNSGGMGGTCAILVARKASFSKENLHTGGQTAPTESDYSDFKGGGGTGFVYIACEEVV